MAQQSVREVHSVIKDRKDGRLIADRLVRYVAQDMHVLGPGKFRILLRTHRKSLRCKVLLLEVSVGLLGPPPVGNDGSKQALMLR
ncbi:hypothetical protein JANAI62_37070 [Jannaschia pagri]|uniref:Uncharacterized protein n=1 Tax=Jannaschia pagri TaxID=2829797 RepID=A0ABQ4NRP4_9RHOB|nr:hypothetical protein JANAI61_37070 [Jannaschia sp. AI_61]GIT97084.1 hypothetical protein JANAI62_37070 [Jannaschia sp. AI_62]